MASPSVPFLTGNFLATDEFVVIAEGTLVSALTAAEQNAKNRKWVLDDTTNGANAPANNYRMMVVVDNSLRSDGAFISLNAGDNPVEADAWRYIPANAIMELWRSQGHIGSEPFSVMLLGADTSDCVVTERSSI